MSNVFQFSSFQDYERSITESKSCYNVPKNKLLFYFPSETIATEDKRGHNPFVQSLI